MINSTDYLDFSKSAAGDYIASFAFPWHSLKELSNFIKQISDKLPDDEYQQISEYVFAHKSASVSSSAAISGPCIIGPETEIRHCAFIRGSVIIGKGCVIGNSTEVKNSVIFDKVQVPHFNYIGDSILGFGVHFGAGVITSNVKSDKTEVSVNFGSSRIATGMRKFGALVGDKAEIGCNTVLNPGSVIGRDCIIYPLSNIRGTIDKNSIYKSAENIVAKVGC